MPRYEVTVRVMVDAPDEHMAELVVRDVLQNETEFDEVTAVSTRLPYTQRANDEQP